jgi:hypothetical protein
MIVSLTLRQRRKLNDRIIAQLTPTPGTSRIYYDTGGPVRGLGVRVTATGAKSWILATPPTAAANVD